MAAHSAWDAAIADFSDETSTRWATPGDMAAAMDHRTVQTPALDLIDQHLVEAFNTPDARLIISMPPQEGKSQRASRRFPLWALTQNNDLRIAIASYEANIARRWGRAIRDDVTQHADMLGLSVRDDLSAQHEWQLNNHDGGVFTAGVGGAMTGRPVDCVRGDMLIESEHGKISAAEAHERGIQWIRAYDHASGQSVWSRVEASRRIDGRKVIEVRTSDGRVLACTPDHRVYTRRGYVPAGRLRRGETLLGIMDDHDMPVRCDLPDPEDGSTEGDPARAKAVLLDRVHPAGHIGHSSKEEVSRVWGTSGPESGQDMLGRVPGEGARPEARPTDLPGMRRDGSREEQSGTVLFSPVCGHGALEADDRSGELALQDGHELREVVQINEAPDSGTRRAQVCGVRVGADHGNDLARETEDSFGSGDSPSEREAMGQPGGESDHSLREVSCSAPQVEGVTVSMVRDLDEPGVSVYDFQVEGTSNFFAGGLLVHNCLIIDDPVKGREQADSETIREKTWDWWTDTALTRLAPGAPVILILTRWHENDLAGRLLAEPESPWVFLNIPAEADHHPEDGGTDPLGREPGEFMVSARGRTRAQWEARKRASGPKTWASLYQGRPSPDKGGVFPTDWATFDQPQWVERGDGSMWVPGVGERDDHELIQSWDLAFKGTGSSDFVVGQVWLRVGSVVYLLDQVRRRMNFTQTLDAVRAMVAKWPQATAKFVEDKANGPAVITSLQREIPGLVPVEPYGSKTARASAVSPFAFSRNIVLPTARLLPNVEDLRTEALNFPNGAHDDTIDALSQAVNQLLLLPLQEQRLIEPEDMWDLEPEPMY